MKYLVIINNSSNINNSIIEYLNIQICIQDVFLLTFLFLFQGSGIWLCYKLRLKWEKKECKLLADNFYSLDCEI